MSELGLPGRNGMTGPLGSAVGFGVTAAPRDPAGPDDFTDSAPPPRRSIRGRAFTLGGTGRTSLGKGKACAAMGTGMVAVLVRGYRQLPPEMSEYAVNGSAGTRIPTSGATFRPITVTAAWLALDDFRCSHHIRS
ncbi:hypothetical protein GCM10027162_11640 [Streptomyces incanus]